VGLTLAARLLENPSLGLELIESDPNKRDILLSGGTYVDEPEILEILTEGFLERRLTVKSELASSRVDVLFITIGTPRPTNQLHDPFEVIAEGIIQTINPNGILLLRSTVSIGTTRRIKSLIQGLGRNDIAVAFVPERTAEGIAIAELRELPQILGSDDPFETLRVVEFLKQNGFEIVTTLGSAEAELAKLACNTWRDVTFAYANELATLGAIYEVDTLNAIESANFNYKRASIPMPGPVGGPCLSKDSYILTKDYSDLLENQSLILRARSQNESLVHVITNYIVSRIGKTSNSHVLICGLAFKGQPKTNDTRDSFGLELYRNLVTKIDSSLISIWDPNFEFVNEGNAQKHVLSAPDSNESMICILANNSQFLRSETSLNFFKSLDSESTVIDLWSNLSSPGTLNAELIQIGRPTWGKVFLESE
jgi:UDP-N-acetyl-D-mannosaminuronic acid dehydrogenase